MKLKIICDNAENQTLSCDMIVTDPPFEMCGKTLSKIVDMQNCDHLLLITTMRQFIDFCRSSNWNLSFDFVFDQVVPKKSKSIHQPNYVHSTCAYLTRNNKKSLFNRKRRGRSDTYDGNGYWPTIFNAPRDRMQEYGYAKNTQALIDAVGCFDVRTIADLFAGSGTIARVCFELEIDCILVEKDQVLCNKIEKEFKFMSAMT